MYRYGRRLSYVLSLALMILGRLVSVISGESFLVFLIGCVIASLPSWSLVQTAAVISVEISSPDRRTTVTTIRFIANSCGVGLMALLYWYLREWKIFTVVTTIILVPHMLMSWTVIESPQWLWTECKPNECIKILKRIAKVNKTNLKSETENELLITQPVTKNKGLGLFALFSSWQLTRNTSLQLCLWASVTLSYTVLLMNSGEKTDGNPFAEFAWQSLAEVPGNILGHWLADTIGRRYTSIISYAVTATMWSLVSFRETYVSFLRNWWVSLILVTVNRLSLATAYYSTILYTMELYPTCLRQSGMSIGNLLSSGASAVAPYILYIGRRYDSRLPGAILAVLALVAVISSFLLPETLNAKLPETMDEARSFGRKQKEYSTITLKRINKDNETEN